MKHKSQQEKEQLIQLYLDSHESKMEFCKAHNLKLSTFKGWLRSFEEQPVTTRFLRVGPISTTSNENKEERITLTIQGIELSFPLTISPTFLGEVIRVSAHV